MLLLLCTTAEDVLLALLTTRRGGGGGRAKSYWRGCAGAGCKFCSLLLRDVKIIKVVSFIHWLLKYVVSAVRYTVSGLDMNHGL